MREDKKIIDNVLDLMKMEEDDLMELLLEDKYNKENLRELLRRTIKQSKELRYMWEKEKALGKEKEYSEQMVEDKRNNRNIRIHRGGCISMGLYGG